MNPIDKLLADAGSWHGINRLNDPNTLHWVESESTAAVVPVLNGKFIRLDYTWGYDGTPQEGSMLISYDPTGNPISAYWIDSWHMGNAVMTLQGTADKDGYMTLRGSYPVPPGPDWGWRIELGSKESSHLSMLMFNITPDGQEFPAVDVNYERNS